MARSHIQIKNREQMRYMRRADRVVADIHAALREAALPGVSLIELDQISAHVIDQAGAKSNFLGYFGYPATVCISVNDTVVHGIPDERTLTVGDIVSFDCGAYIMADGRQWHGDAAFTMIIGDHDGSADAAAKKGELDPEVLLKRRQLNEITRNAMWAAIAAVARGKRLAVVGEAVEETVEKAYETYGWEAGIIEEYTGHGIGTAMHQDPEVLNYRVRGITPKLRPGMCIAIEPMLVGGSQEVFTEDDEWTVRTSDGSDAAHWEHSIAICDDGVSVLSAPDSGRAGLEPYGITPVILDN